MFAAINRGIISGLVWLKLIPAFDDVGPVVRRWAILRKMAEKVLAGWCRWQIFRPRSP
jgi:hypothetical protein